MNPPLECATESLETSTGYRSARLGAPVGGALAGTCIEELLEALLAGTPSATIVMGAGRAPYWGPRLDALGRTWVSLVLSGISSLDTLMDAVLAQEHDFQVWLNLDRSPALDALDLIALEAFLAFAASRSSPPLVVLLRDDASSLPRTQRLAVDRLGNILLVREAPGGALALGMPAVLETMAETLPWAPLPLVTTAASVASARCDRHLLVLDVDGVLIDPGRAFADAVSGALAELAPGLAWDDGFYAAFKRVGGFNNDFRLTAAALALAEEEGLEALEAAAGVGFPHLEARIRELEPLCQITVQKHYGRTRRLERPLVSRQDLAVFKGELAIFTGRPPQELALAFEVLTFRLPAVSDSAAHLRKPRPEGLLQLADAFRAGRVFFVGDTVDDATALSGARALRPDLDWRFAAVGPDRARFAQEGDLQAEGLKEVLAELESGSRP